MNPHKHNGIDSVKLFARNIINLITGYNAIQKTGDQQIDGVKTFTSIPVLPATDATSDNEMLRKSQADALDIPDYEIIASDDIVDSADTLETTQNEAPFKKKQITYNEKNGTIRVYFEAQSLNGDEYANAELYINDVATGEEIHTKNHDTEWATHTVDIEVETGDKLQLYLDRDNDGYGDTARCRYFRLKYKTDLTPTPGTINLN